MKTEVYSSMERAGLFAALFVEPLTEKSEYPAGRYDHVVKRYVEEKTGRPAFVWAMAGSCTAQTSCTGTTSGGGGDSDTRSDSEPDQD